MIFVLRTVIYYKIIYVLGKAVGESGWMDGWAIKWIDGQLMNGWTIDRQIECQTDR